MSVIRIYWEEGMNSHVYFNNGKDISFQEALKEAKEKNYLEIQEDWKGPIPVDLWKRLETEKSQLRDLSLNKG